MTQNYIKTRVRLPNNNESNLFTYVPVAGYTNPGIVAFNENQFSINNDTHIVTLNTNFTNQYYTKTEVYNKTEVNTLLSEKVSKVTESRRIYATDANGNTTTYPWSVSRTAYNTNIEKNSFVRRSEGRIPGIADPSDDHDAANKHYIDTNFASLSGNNTFTGYNSFEGDDFYVDVNQNIEVTSGDLTVINTDGTDLQFGDSRFGTVSLYGNVTVMGSISWGSAPTDNYHLTNKFYVDTGLSTKVNKLSDIEAPAVYVGNPNGTQTYKYLDNLALGDSVPLRDSNGNIYVGDATQSGHATSKGYVDTAIAAQIGRVYKPAGTLTFAELISTIDLDVTNLGNVYNITDSFTTTSDFMEGAGVSYPEGTNVAVVQDGNDFYFDVLVGAVDLSGYAYLEAESNSFSGNMEVGGDLQVYGDLLNINGHTYINSDDQATAAEMAEILAVLS